MLKIYKCGIHVLIQVFIILSFDSTLCSIDGSFVPRKPESKISKFIDDLCHPLYWYPRKVPDFCFYRKKIVDGPCLTEDSPPIPMPIPIPSPVPVPPMPVPGIPIPAPGIPMPGYQVPAGAVPYPLPFGIPLAPSYPMLPVASIGNIMPAVPLPAPLPPPVTPAPAPPIIPRFPAYIPPYGVHRRSMSMVPGLPGLVAPDGGINILPFSDAYADLLEKHKQKMIRLRLQKLLDEYDGFGQASIEDF
ncbi:uncharacterized protein LOC142986350 isoform X2 [Anticarsia gemmatalis]